MSYERVKDLRTAEFKRYCCGVEPETLSRMVELVSKRLTKARRKAGRPPKLSVEDLGLQRLHEKSRTPREKPRKSQLTDEQRRSNRELARRRVVVEHVIRSLKIFRTPAERYRNRR
jgi:hypothetical protein